jgi:hypothetical protein
MLRWPAPDRLSKTSHVVLERFKKTGVAKELEQDSREWVLVTWPWVPDPPYTIVARASDAEERRCVMGEDGLWTVSVSEQSTHPTAAA